jgi:hypothetical protein
MEKGRHDKDKEASIFKITFLTYELIRGDEIAR